MQGQGLLLQAPQGVGTAWKRVVVGKSPVSIFIEIWERNIVHLFYPEVLKRNHLPQESATKVMTRQKKMKMRSLQRLPEVIQRVLLTMDC